MFFRANRQKLEQLLAEGLDVRWEYALADIKPTTDGLSLLFENGETVETPFVVGAEGVHSQVRKIFCPSTTANVVLFTVYNGKRRLDLATFDKKYAPYMNGVNILTHKTSDALLHSSRTTTNGSALQI